MDLTNLKSNSLIEKRLQEFKDFENKASNEWFSELCFCILTANSKAQNAINIQNEIGVFGFLNYPQEQIAQIIKNNKHRFHNNKSKYIVAAREFKNIKEFIKKFNSGVEARNFIVTNIKGLGFKESSHFLRNVGYTDVAIIDRHILKFMKQSNLIAEIPKTITKKIYIEFEKILKNISSNQAELDLIIWEKVTGKVLK